MKRAKTYLGMLMLAVFTLFIFVATVQAQDILFTLLQEQSPDNYWAGKENMVYDPWTYPTGPLGYDDVSSDWFGMNKGNMGTGHQFISEIGFDTTFSGCNAQGYYFKNLTSEGYFILSIDDSNNVRYEKVDIKNWATPTVRLHEMSDFPDWTVAGYYGSSGTYDPDTNELNAKVNLNYDFQYTENQNAWIKGYSQVGYIIPKSEFGDLRPYPDGDGYPITHYVYDPNGGPPPYPGEYAPDGTTQAAEGLFHYMVNNFSELADADYLYLGISRDNFKNDESMAQGKKEVDGGNFFVIDASEWPILTKPFLNKESLWVAAGKDIYIRHLGIDENGEDVFPQEVVDEDYYTGAASVLQALKFFDSDYWQSTTQEDLYNAYHDPGAPGEDMTASEVKNALNTETNANSETVRYNFGAFAYSNENDAMKRIIYWIDYEVPDVPEPNAPGHVPTDGAYNWKTVRGFVSNKDPYRPMPDDLEVYGLWLNDPKVNGLGYNVYLTADEFRNIYEPIDGYYRFVSEPPQGVDMAELDAMLDSIDIKYAAGRPNTKLANAFTSIRLEKGIMTLEKKEKLFDDVRWETVIPAELLIAADFKNIYSRTKFNGALAVDDLETGEDYQLVLFSQSGKENTASVVLIVEEDTGMFRQASWTSKDQTYLTEEKVLEIAKEAMHKICESAAKDWKIRLVWNKKYNQSRFQPMYEVVFMPYGPTVYVLQDGSYFVKKFVEKEKIAVLEE